ncbi:MAG: putative membrane protein [Rhodobacteraceae bacterium HLUCCA12]|nr:MAG: putative membrane protein [Rhodobacteraceae bacterium HLUCCA12]
MRIVFEHRSLLAPLAPVAVVVAAFAFTTALTPSLIPRTGALQGLLAGAAFVVVYALTAALGSAWAWLGLPVWRPRWMIIGTKAAALGIMIYGLAHVTEWQNVVNAVSGLPPVESARPQIITGVALAVILPMIALGRLVRMLVVFAANWLAWLMPARLALIGSLALTAILFWTVGSGVLGSAILRTLDEGARQVDALIDDGQPRPSASVHSGSRDSLIDWDSLGAFGRWRIGDYPSTAEIAEVAGPDGPEVKTPARVYVGLNSARTPEESATLALDELRRIDAFSREVLVIATPTGTGWVHPASVSPMEFLWRGDVASVSVQYSYLPSWLTLLVDPDYGVATARAVFAAIRDHWQSLPPDSRPRLYLNGLSLGSRNSELSFEVWGILGTPFDGAFWIGPTFTNPLWQAFTARRTPTSPAWRPVVGSGNLVRFATQQGIPDHGYHPWGPVRLLYLQHPSDAVTFFDPESLYRRPEWLSPRAPDVSPAFRWVPIVTFLQLFADLVAGFRTPIGVGHAYAARDFIDGWHALTDPPGWSEERLDALREWYAVRGR